jgi:pimeloyl-ACP methyl ester carboxylesterase
MDTDTDALGALLDAAYEAGDLDEISRLEAWIWLDGPGSPEGRVTGASRDLFLEMNRVALANELPENAGDSALEAWDRLAEIEAPTLVICGDLDVPHLLERSRLLPQRLGHARYHEITGMAHLPYLEDAGLITGLVQEALNARA